ncbi:MAG TPA: isoaspartyl peptidase/L-asparaginase [Thermoplasmataceae archaeon]|nr:isoaspartyl peptidase/L-asparaginase [Thermoplasmataceae archaeon]
MQKAVLIHGGAGSGIEATPKLMDYARASSSKDRAIDVAVEAVRLMEDDPDFNAGTGSVKRIDGSIQMDAAVMVPGRIGSVIAIERVRNPILVARAVMEKSPHVIISGDGAVRFARIMGFPDYDPTTKRSQEIYEKMMKVLNGGEADLPDRYREYRKYSHLYSNHPNIDTVGAVSRVDGNFAAAVSTGGSSPMIRGRVGDSPIPGAGLYCGPKGAVVATGIGEEIIRRMLCYRVYEEIESGNLQNTLDKYIDEFNGVLAGIIAINLKEMASASNSSMATGHFTI